jgi:cobyrinic acid a,c-diamide synthase
VIAGTASGVGKTTLMVALLHAFRARGLRVAAFKCGPDYLDPTYHARASGRPAHNLDGWMMGEEAVRRTFAHAAAGADLALVEGMMGLYDGAAPDSNAGSAAEIARWLEAPVVAVTDASAVARTLAAIGLGLAQFDPQLRLVGLFANRVGGRGHLELLRTACQAAVPILGGLPSEPALAFPERHLGLHAAELVDEASLEGWGALVEAWCPLDQLLAIARSAPPLALPQRPPVPARSKCRIGIARDAAFHFYYEENLMRLGSLGAELVPFSPLTDAALPPNLDGLYLGGGYPEAHARRLAANGLMRQAVRAFADRGRPVYAECGGLMYLVEGLRTLDGETHEMAGLLPGVAVMRESLQAIGYVDVETRVPTVLGPAGLKLRGHQFRHSVLEGAEPLAYTVKPRWGGGFHGEGYLRGNVLGSYVHVHWASCPGAAEGFVAAARSSRQVQA